MQPGRKGSCSIVCLKRNWQSGQTDFKEISWILAKDALFPIVVTDPYPDNYDECLNRAADEKAERAD